MRSLQLNVTGQPFDVYATSPWRAPGSAPVFGSGCGVAGGSKDVYLNGGSIRGYPQGDGYSLDNGDGDGIGNGDCGVGDNILWR